MVIRIAFVVLPWTIPHDLVASSLLRNLVPRACSRHLSTPFCRSSLAFRTFFAATDSGVQGKRDAGLSRSFLTSAGMSYVLMKRVQGSPYYPSLRLRLESIFPSCSVYCKQSLCMGEYNDQNQGQGVCVDVVFPEYTMAQMRWFSLDSKSTLGIQREPISRPLKSTKETISCPLHMNMILT